MTQDCNFFKIPGISFNPIGFLELPLLIIFSYTCRSHFRYDLLLPMFLLYLWKECVPMSVCLHRYFSHKGFSCGRVTQFVLYTIGCLASQGPPLWWASMHRKHHAHCDTIEDPHSPIVYDKLYAWLGWVYMPSGDGPLGRGHDMDLIKDHLQFPELVIGENLYWLPIVTFHYIFYVYGGIGWVVYVSMLSGCLCQVLTLYFNVAFHSGPDSMTDNGVVCRAADIRFDLLSQIFGEAYHGWHHRHPLAYKRPGLDLPYWIFILPGLKTGLFRGHNKMYKIRAQ